MYCLQHAPLVKRYPVNETLHDTMANGSAVFIVLLSLSFLCVSCVFQHTRYTIVLEVKLSKFPDNHEILGKEARRDVNNVNDLDYEFWTC